MDSEQTILLKPAEVAAHLRITTRSVYRLINTGALPKVHVGEARATRIRRSDLIEYIEHPELRKTA